MAKAKTTTKTKMRIDVMSITVLLVIALFGGFVGYYVGLSHGISQTMAMIQTR
jgi:uncharacterized membrane protein YsdA (DUF1294 family)